MENKKSNSRIIFNFFTLILLVFGLLCSIAGMYFSPANADETNSPYVTIYFEDSVGWGTVYYYYWTEGNTTYMKWPGDAMTYNGKSEDSFDVYTISIPKYAYVIFNNGVVTEEGVTPSVPPYQTVDIDDIKDGDCFRATVLDDYGKYLVEKIEYNQN